MDQLPSLDRFNRIVIKVGSSLLVDGALGAVRHAWLKALASDISALHGRGASMVVVGSRGHGEFVGMLVGSVSEYCVTNAHCPVLVHRVAG